MRSDISSTAAAAALAATVLLVGVVGAQAQEPPSWEQATIPGTGTEPPRISDVAAGGPGFIAVGGVTASGTERVLQTIPDGAGPGAFRADRLLTRWTGR